MFICVVSGVKWPSLTVDECVACDGASRHERPPPPEAFGVWCVRCGDWGSVCWVGGLEFGVWGLGFGVWGLGLYFGLSCPSWV